jgi:hypothetical protein
LEIEAVPDDLVELDVPAGLLAARHVLRAAAAEDRRHDCHPISRADAADLGADRLDDARELVAEDRRQADAGDAVELGRRFR